MDLDFKVESDSYGNNHFPIVLKIGVSLPDSLPRWNFSRADWVTMTMTIVYSPNKDPSRGI